LIFGLSKTTGYNFHNIKNIVEIQLHIYYQNSHKTQVVF